MGCIYVCVLICRKLAALPVRTWLREQQEKRFVDTVGIKNVAELKDKFLF